MRQLGFNLEIIRGETTSVTYTFTDRYGHPFILPTTATYAFLQLHFKVKDNAYSISTDTYIIDKVFDVNSYKRFDSVDIINIQTYSPSTYNALMWDDSEPPLEADMNRLFYHPALNEYRYYDSVSASWVIYEFVVTIPFEIADTVNLDYKVYSYDLVLEAGTDANTIAYNKVMISQHSLTITYRV